MVYGESLYLSYPDFGSHIQTVWKLSRKEQDFCDVTLICEDRFIEAHKFVIGSSSPVLKNILAQISNQAAFIYLKGVKYKDLQNILRFIYEGEVNVETNDIPGFFEVANDLKIKGLSKSMENETDSKENIAEVSEGREALCQNDVTDNVKEIVNVDSINFLMHEKNGNKEIESTSEENVNISNYSHPNKMFIKQYDDEIKMPEDVIAKPSDVSHISGLSMQNPNLSDQATLLEYDTLDMPLPTKANEVSYIQDLSIQHPNFNGQATLLDYKYTNEHKYKYNKSLMNMSSPSKVAGEKRKREKRKNYDRAESQILIDLVSSLYNGKFKEQIKSNKTSNDQRHKIWQQVTKYFNSATGNCLTSNQVRNKYGREKIKMRKKESQTTV